MIVTVPVRWLLLGFVSNIILFFKKSIKIQDDCQSFSMIAAIKLEQVLSQKCQNKLLLSVVWVFMINSGYLGNIANLGLYCPPAPQKMQPSSRLLTVTNLSYLFQGIYFQSYRHNKISYELFTVIVFVIRIYTWFRNSLLWLVQTILLISSRGRKSLASLVQEAR